MNRLCLLHPSSILLLSLMLGIFNRLPVSPSRESELRGTSHWFAPWKKKPALWRWNENLFRKLWGWKVEEKTIKRRDRRLKESWLTYQAVPCVLHGEDAIQALSRVNIEAASRLAWGFLCIQPAWKLREIKVSAHM